ncbi:ABC transporter substrate-binding protein [Georgenia alba]|uniref:ABC transporter substrate-binding protein n=1 Tax=Georgenia alba TaxID=2233858 RepID=A0ABW2Q8D7_9MICO
MALSLSLTAACGSSPADGGEGGQEIIAITAGVAASPTSAPLFIGVEQGFFEEEGIDLTLDDSATGAGAIPQLINGQLQVALGALSPAITAVAEGIPVVMVSGSVNDREDPAGTQYQTLVPGDSDIESFSDLAGHTVGVNSLRCCWEFWIREAIEQEGGDASTVEFLQLPFPDAATALRQGDVDAISTLQPFATALRQEGFRDIGDSAAIAFDNPNNGNTTYYMAQQFIEENPGVLERWRTALQRSSDYANEHPEETRSYIVDQTGTDAALVDAAPLPMYTAEIDRETIEREAEFLVKYGVLEEAPGLDEIIAP